MTDKPIEPQDYLYGVKVVDIGDLRIARGKTRRPYESCKHMALVYDNNERRIYCSDCERDVEAFDAFETLVERWNGMMVNLKRRESEIVQAESFTARRLATKTLDAIWRKKDEVPNCPHCNEALLPEDFVNTRVKRSSARLARARRERRKA